MSPELLNDYQSLLQGKGFVWHDDRTLLKFTGPDRAKFLHNFCTANVNAMQAGDVGEAFVLDTRGKTLSFGHILQFETEIVWTAAGKEFAAELHAHFDRYIIREDVTVEDISSNWSTAIEPISPEVIESDWGAIKDRCREEDVVRTAASELAGPSRIHFVRNEDREALAEKLSTSASESALEALHVVRMQFGTPWYGIEVDQSNLPQEFRRDDKAISFTKGCYLGQETVAKIDAIGHVNRFMVGLKFDSGNVAPGADIKVDDKKVGEIRSVTFSPKLESEFGIGFVKRQLADPGTQIEIGDGNRGEIVELPVV